MEPGEPAEPTEPAASPPPAFDPQDSGGSETLTKEQFAALPVQTYGSIRRHTRASFDQQGDPECAICQSEYEAGDVVTRVPCLHFFHQDCIQQWLTKGAGHCPICRCTVTVDLDE
ncbi:hypothetical protein H4R18_004804 [Coemansia javaensis]|uniref:RING-type domain-containing protein n=1 Tax=Coemansia javaensis TaxID=2761396 RepID=A0A9W8H9R7_9FUNG|nr:hypothetical protein H4R18_004804 [Coemansia javaensis]